jgi:hypothetical protein
MLAIVSWLVYAYGALAPCQSPHATPRPPTPNKSLQFTTTHSDPSKRPKSPQVSPQFNRMRVQRTPSYSKSCQVSTGHSKPNQVSKSHSQSTHMLKSLYTSHKPVGVSRTSSKPPKSNQIPPSLDKALQAFTSHPQLSQSHLYSYQIPTSPLKPRIVSTSHPKFPQVLTSLSKVVGVHRSPYTHPKPLQAQPSPSNAFPVRCRSLSQALATSASTLRSPSHCHGSS